MVSTRYFVLGPLSVETEGGKPLPPTGPKIRTLLACLLLRVNNQVSVESLADFLWYGDPPQNPRRVVQTYMVRLRHWLGDHDAIHTKGGAYTIHLDAAHLDLLEFRRLRRLAEQSEDPAEEAAILRQAIDLWRGPVCQDVASEVLQQMDAPIVHEEYHRALERRIDLDLQTGNYRDLVPELWALTVKHPLRERHWAQLMVALTQSGRTADALEAYRIAFSKLRDGLGIEPGTELRKLHQSILTGRLGEHDPYPQSPTPARRPPEGQERTLTVPPRELPADLHDFVGRAKELDYLSELRSAVGTAVIVGDVGVGKTALAIRWAASETESFPDGQLYLDLRGYDSLAPRDTAEALRLLLGSLGVPADDVPADPAAAAALFRSRTAGRRMLILLDNAADTSQVLPLLPGSGPTVVVTSRHQLRGLVARGRAGRITLRGLGPDESIALLEGMVGRERLQQERFRTAKLAELCEHLPLALRIAGERLARVPDLSIGALVREIENQSVSRSPFSPGDDPGADLYQRLSWSCRRLDAETRRTLHLLTEVYPGHVLLLEPAAAVVDRPVEQVREQLHQLATYHLLEELCPNRYQLSLRLRTYAAAIPQDTPPNLPAAADSFLSWLRHQVSSAVAALTSGHDEQAAAESAHFADRFDALRWSVEHRSMLAAFTEWAQRHHREEVRLTQLIDDLLLHSRGQPGLAGLFARPAVIHLSPAMLGSRPIAVRSREVRAPS